jgi:anti-sigma-K factor RskA
MNWDEVKELAPLYVIGALDAETSRAVESSLQGATPEQRREVAGWYEVAALLPESLSLPSPSEGFKDRLLARIAEEEQETPVEIAVKESLVKEIAEREEQKILSFATSRRAESRFESRTTRWLLIAATALLAFTSTYLFGQNVKLARERDQISQELNAEKKRVDDFVSSTTKVIALTGDATPQANAKVIWDTKTQQWVIYIFDLPAPPSDKDYQLWYVTKNAKISAAVFRTDASGRTVLKLTLPPTAMAGLAATAVTLEPKGGSAQPTSNIYLKGAI